MLALWAHQAKLPPADKSPRSVWLFLWWLHDRTCSCRILESSNSWEKPGVAHFHLHLGSFYPEGWGWWAQLEVLWTPSPRNTSFLVPSDVFLLSGSYDICLCHLSVLSVCRISHLLMISLHLQHFRWRQRLQVFQGLEVRPPVYLSVCYC